jgi:iron(III) transport system ATP-binding protein
MPEIHVEGLVKQFGEQRALHDVTFHVVEGELFTLLGPSGCGKSTTLMSIAGFQTPEEGRIAVGDETFFDAARHVSIAAERRNLGMVFQSYAVWPHMTVFENVAYPLKVRRWKRDAIRAKVQQALDLVGLSNEGPRPATALSGGQMQRIALARALVFDPALLLFDEPLSNLDLKLRERLRVELKTLQRRTGITSIYVTHDQTEAVELGDRVVVMEAGKVVQIGAPVELYQRPETRFVAEFIGSANIGIASVQALEGPGVARVRTDNGASLSGAIDGEVSVGDAVDIVVHPEDCRLTSAVGTGNGGFAVNVLERRYQGVFTRYIVDWNGRKFDVVALGTSSEIEEGSPAWMWIDRARLIRRVGA